MDTCINCGATVGENARFCSQCGKPPWSEASGEGGIAWRIEIPLLNNRFILGSIGNAFGVLTLIMFVIIGAIFGWANGWEGIVQAALLCVGLLVFLSLVTLFSLGLVLGNRYQLEFRVAEPGIEMISRSRRSRMANRLALIAGILARNPGVAGAGVAGLVTEIVGVGWEEVHGLVPTADRAVIRVQRRFLPDMYVFCLPENFETVLAYMTERVTPGGRS